MEKNKMVIEWKDYGREEVVVKAINYPFYAQTDQMKANSCERKDAIATLRTTLVLCLEFRSDLLFGSYKKYYAPV